MTAILHLLAPAPTGGLESVVVALASGQLERGHDAAVGAIVEPEALPHPAVERLRARGVPTEVLKVPHRAYPEEVRSVRELLGRRDPDIVHTHGYRCDVVAARVARGRGFPVVSTAHGFTGGGWKNRLYERLQRRSLLSHDAVVAVSRPIAARLREAGVPSDRLHVVPNAWEAQGTLRSREEARDRLGLDPDGPVVGWVGRLSAEKGVDVLLRALALPDAAGVDASLLGEGPAEEESRRLACELGIGDRVRFHGRAPDAAALYRAFDVFVLSSRTEGTPISLFEAMEAEVPVVATRVGGVPDVVTEEQAILVEPEDPGALARAVRAVVGDPEAARERATRAKERLRERFAVGPWLVRYDEIYRSVSAPKEEVGT